MHAEKQDVKSLFSGAKRRKRRWRSESNSGSTAGVWDAEPEGSWQEDKKWVEELNNYGYSILTSYAFTLGCFME